MLMATGMPLGQAQAFIFPVGFGIQDARNIAWYMAEHPHNHKGEPQPPYEYFMFWDDDVVPVAFGAVEAMIQTMEQNPEIDILGGVYPARQGAPVPIVVLNKDDPPWWGWEDGGIHRVYLTGTGFTMYRVERFKLLGSRVETRNTPIGPLPLPQHFDLLNGTDDYDLAARAARAGLRWYVHGGVVAHQIEPTGQIHDINNARHRIVEVKDESEAAQGSNGSTARIRPERRRQPADVRAG